MDKITSLKELKTAIKIKSQSVLGYAKLIAEREKEKGVNAKSYEIQLGRILNAQGVSVGETAITAFKHIEKDFGIQEKEIRKLFAKPNHRRIAYSNDVTISDNRFNVPVTEDILEIFSLIAKKLGDKFTVKMVKEILLTLTDSEESDEAHLDAIVSPEHICIISDLQKKLGTDFTVQKSINFLIVLSENV